MTTRNLIIIHRGPRYLRDFDEIATKVNALDPSITVYHLPASLERDLPAGAWRHPSLTIAFTSKYRLPVRRGPVLHNHQIDKLLQSRMFVENGIPTPASRAYDFGMALDPIQFGDIVVLKTRDLEDTSHGDAVQLFRRSSLQKKRLSDFPPDHAFHRSRVGYIVQKFIDTGELPSYNRIQTFLGKAIYAWNVLLHTPRASFDAPDDELERSKISNQGDVPKTRRFISDPDVLALAERVHAMLPRIPMLAVDIVREASSGKLFVLECNPGGNTWHFSSSGGWRIRRAFGNAAENGTARADEIARQMLIDQFGAFDIVARQLVKATDELAS